MRKILKYKRTAAGWLSVLLLLLGKSDVFAAAPPDLKVNDRQDMNQDYVMDYSDIDEMISEMGGENISFSQLVREMMSGQLDFSLKTILSWILDKVFEEVAANKGLMMQMIAVAVIGAVFANFSAAFSKKYVAETGFYLTYMIMFLMIAASFAVSANIAVKVVDGLVGLMQVLVPAFCTAVTFSLGVSTSHAWYQLLMMLVVAVDWLMAKFLMRFIKIYVVISMVNQMTEEDYFSKMGELFKTVVQWSLRTILGVTLGLNLIQGMVLPAFDSVKNGVMAKMTSVIPGVGDALGAAAKAAIGSGVLLKNAVGTAGVIIICVVCAWPLLQLLAVVLMYKVIEALIQPISDSRLTACVHVAGEGIMMLLKACGTVILLFVISMAMMTSVSNVALTTS